MSETDRGLSIPGHWKRVKLGQLITKTTEKVEPGSVDSLPYLGLKHFEQGTGKLSGKGDAEEVSSTKSLFREGDILYGKLRPYLNKVWRASFDGICSTDILVFRTTDQLLPEFLHWRLLCSDFVAYADQNSSGVNHPRVSFKEVSEYPIGVPPLLEQRRIVTKIEELFSNLDAGMDDLQVTGQQLERYRKSVLQAAVEGRLTADWRRTHDPEPADQLLERILEKRQDQWEERYRWERYDSKGKEPPSGWKDRYSPPEDPEENTSDTLPDGWCWVTIDQITQTVTKGSSPGHQGFEYKEEGIPFLRSQNVRWGELDLEGIEHLDESFNEAQSKSVIEEDDVFLNIVGASIGRAAKADERLDGANMNQAVALIRPVLSLALPEYMVIYLLSPTMQNYIEQKKVEVARANLNLGEIKSFEIPLPPLQEMKQLVSEVNRQLSIADNAEESAKQEATRAERLRQSILKQAFSGQLVPNEEGASPPSIDGTASEESDTGFRSDADSDVEDLMGSADPSKQIEMDL